MPIVNSSSNSVVREFSLKELEQAARLMRGYDLVALCAAGLRPFRRHTLHDGDRCRAVSEGR